MIYTEKTVAFKVSTPLYLPFYNQWGRNVYETAESFDFDPFTINASSTSGSPVVLAKNKFFGFMNRSGGRVSFDGIETLTFTLSEGQKLYVCDNCDPSTEWQKYNALVVPDEKHTNEPFWSKLEYCTWVEQKKVAMRAKEAEITANVTNEAQLCGSTPATALTESFIYDYMERIERLGLPKGKLTIDDGWYVFEDRIKNYLIGDWDIDRARFPHFEQLIKDISAHGFVPGLWFSPFTATENSRIGTAHPELLGACHDPNRKWHYLHFDEKLLRPYFTEIFSKFLPMGIKKLKLDISYGPKNEMTDILALLYEIIKDIQPEAEVEAHIPDIFASRYADTVRLNDVAFDDAGNWRKVAGGHYFVCRNSAYNRILNLDHIGTNTPMPKKEDFSEHVKMQKEYFELSGGYPVVSLLPDFFDEDVCGETVAILNSMYLPDGSPR